MKYQPRPSYSSNDDVQTPPELCELVVDALVSNFYGSALEPCFGEGNFYAALEPYFESIQGYDIRNGTDFLHCNDRYDWIITNPPWSKYKAFMNKAFQVADNVVFLATLNHALGLKSRWNLCDKYGFGVRKVLLLDTPPKPWPQMGFQLGAVWWAKSFGNTPTFVDLRGGNHE